MRIPRVSYYNVSLTFTADQESTNFESVYATTNFNSNELQNHFGNIKINSYKKISELSYLYHLVKQKLFSPVRFIYE